jgi:hypothetical protein
MKTLLLWLFFSLSLAQSFTGTYAVNDPASGTVFNLKLIENPDQTLTGNFLFDTTPTMISGKVTSLGMAEAIMQDETGGSFAFSLQLNEPQIILKATDTGDEIALTRESSEVPELIQIEVSSQPNEDTSANEPFSDDPKFNECMTLLEDKSSDTQKVADCQAYIESVMDQSIEEGTGSEDEFDPEELAYCQEFLADSEAVAEDPDEASYCQSYITTFGQQTPQSTAEPIFTTSPLETFAGTFRGQDIALTLQGDGDYTGTLEFKGQSYPVKATAEGNNLKGTFNVNGTSFDFTAILEDTTLTLESAGEQYPMLKDPASN